MIIFAASGCSKLLGGLRKDLDETQSASQPTVGGAWPEHSMLTSGDDNTRNPASDIYNGAQGRGSWMSAENAEQNARDQIRGQTGEEEARINSANTQVLSPNIKRVYKSGGRASKADFVDDTPNETSLWAGDGQSNFFFSKNKVREVGDIVNITIENDLYKDLNQEVTRALTPMEREYELEQAAEREKAKDAAEDLKKDSLSTSSAASKPKADKKDDGKQEKVNKTTAQDIDIASAVDLKSGDNLMAEILERFPNGNYRIRGLKKVRYRNSTKYVSMVGIVRGQDISDEGVVNSGKLYEYRLDSAKF